LTALDEYDMTLEEDNNTNRLEASLQVFESVREGERRGTGGERGKGEEGERERKGKGRGRGKQG
jgi:hypothetical protein